MRTTRATTTAAALSLAAAISLAALGAASPAAADPPPAELGTLSAIATATTAQLSGWSTAIERGHVQAALAQVHATESPSTPGWSDLLGSQTPSASDAFSVAFDDGQNTASGLPDSFGTRVGILTTIGGGGFAGTVLTLEGDHVTCALGDDIDTAAALLAAVGGDLACPTPAPTEATAVTGMWAWGNSVDPSLDNRGLGQADMAPAAMADFATAHGITSVYLSVPWAANQGAIADWLSASVTALHGAGVTVSALGGDAGWASDPSLAAQWAADALDAADFDAVELDVEPWAGVTSPDFGTITPQLIGVVEAVHAEAATLPVGIDLPWWLATTAYGPSTVFDAVLAHVDSVAIVAFADHAAGTDGIVALASPAVTAAAGAGIPFSIGVETDSAAVAGGAQYTFADDGAAVLATETQKVEDAFGTTAGYTGVRVEHLLSWAALPL